MNSFSFPPSFILLQQEGHLLSSCLANGLTDLRSAHVHNKGAFYSSLFNLSVGFERLLKSILIIDFMLENKLSVPSKSQLKSYGHNILVLYDACELIARKVNVPLASRCSYDEIDKEILELLSDFAKSSRYHNFDTLSSGGSCDPLGRWGEIIIEILKVDVPSRSRDKILAQGQLATAFMGDNTMTIMHGLDGRPISTSEALTLPGLQDQAVKYAVFRIVMVLSSLREVLSELCHNGYALNNPLPPFPQMQEFLEWLWDDKQYVLRKKRWP